MPSKRAILAFTVANLGVLWQWQLKDLIYNTFGVSRILEPLADFSYSCRRINDHNLAACEDAWLDEPSRQLFLACSNALGRKAWNPNVAHFAAERRSQHDHIVALNIDTPSPSDPNAFDYRLLDLGTFTNALGDPSINLVGMSGVRTPTGALNLYFINAQPTYNATTARLAPQAITGANATIEAFTLPSPSTSTTLTHLHTFYNPTWITTPNRPAALPDGSIYITNDHGPHKVGLQHILSPVLRTGTIAHCLPPTSPTSHARCHPVGGTHAFPNGLLHSSEHNLLFVPSSVTGKVTIYQPTGRGNESTLTKLADVATTYPLDNISEDADGDLYVAGFPKLNAMMAHTKVATPIDGTSAPSVVLRIRKQKGKAGGKEEWVVKKVLEDGLAETLPAGTTVVRDAKTGRLFVVGVVSPWIAVCEPAKSRR